MCFGPGTLGPGVKTCLESSIKKVNPILFLIAICLGTGGDDVLEQLAGFAAIDAAAASDSDGSEIEI
jgi:hypothetical protein